MVKHLARLGWVHWAYLFLCESLGGGRIHRPHLRVAKGAVYFQKWRLWVRWEWKRDALLAVADAEFARA